MPCLHRATDTTGSGAKDRGVLGGLLLMDMVSLGLKLVKTEARRHLQSQKAT